MHMLSQCIYINNVSNSIMRPNPLSGVWHEDVTCKMKLIILMTTSVAWWRTVSTLKRLKYFLHKLEIQCGFFQFEIIINVLVSSSHFFWLPMLWVYGHYNFIQCFIMTRYYDVYRPQILTSKIGSRAERVNHKTCITKTALLINVLYK